MPDHNYQSSRQYAVEGLLQEVFMNAVVVKCQSGRMDKLMRVQRPSRMIPLDPGWLCPDTPRIHPCDAERHPVQRAAGGEIQRPSVRIAPGHVVRVAWCIDRAEVPTLGREDPQPAGAGDLEIALAGGQGDEMAVGIDHRDAAARCLEPVYLRHGGRDDLFGAGQREHFLRCGRRLTARRPAENHRGGGPQYIADSQGNHNGPPATAALCFVVMSVQAIEITTLFAGKSNLA